MKKQTEQQVLQFLNHIEAKFEGFPITVSQAKSLREKIERELMENEK